MRLINFEKIFIPERYSYSMISKFIDCKISFILYYMFGFNVSNLYTSYIQIIYHHLMELIIRESNSLANINYANLSEFVNSVKNNLKFLIGNEKIIMESLKNDNEVSEEIHDIADRCLLPKKYFSYNNILFIDFNILKYALDFFDNKFSVKKFIYDVDSFINFLNKKYSFQTCEYIFLPELDFTYSLNNNELVTRHDLYVDFGKRKLVIDYKFGKSFSLSQLKFLLLPFVDLTDEFDIDIIIYSFYEKKPHLFKVKNLSKIKSDLISISDWFRKYMDYLSKYVGDIFEVFNKNYSKFRKKYCKDNDYIDSVYLELAFEFSCFTYSIIEFLKAKNIKFGKLQFCKTCIFNNFCLLYDISLQGG